MSREVAPESKSRGIFYQKGGFMPKHCNSPVLVPQVVGLPGNGGYSWVPCGSCPQCLTRRRSEWYSRLKLEWQLHDYSHFITLTYDDEHLIFPSVNPEDGSYCLSRDPSRRVVGPASVCKSDVQGFLKRLRHEVAGDYGLRKAAVARYNRRVLSGRGVPAGASLTSDAAYVSGDYPRLRYYLISEYGPTTHRPHYHIILFGWDPAVDLHMALGRAWRYSTINSATPLIEERLMYVASYHLDRFVAPEGAEPNFVLMSRNPGIGHSYSRSAFTTQWHVDPAVPDRSLFLLDSDGSRLPLTRYLRRKIFGSDFVPPVQSIPEDPRPREEVVAASLRKEATRRRKSKKHTGL